MTESALQNTDAQYTRDIDPNIRQRRAAQPGYSVWVNASAGTGKTKVLTDRLLRLLLPQENGPGTPAHKILCLTFTKAGANEMAIRINGRLGEWAVMPEEKLAQSLENLLGRKAEPEEQRAARRLFSDIIDIPGGLKIMTIHSFCQSVLSRFPLEAGLPPDLKILDDSESSRMLLNAQRDIFKASTEKKDRELDRIIRNIAGVLNEERFTDLLKSIVRERRQLEQILERHFGIEGLYTAICAELDVPAGKNSDTLLHEFCNDTHNIADLDEAGKILAERGTKTYQDKAAILLQWIEKNNEERAKSFSLYKSVFLKADGDIYEKLANKAVIDANPHVIKILENEAIRIQNLQEKIKRAECARFTIDILQLAASIIKRYQDIKETNAALDYDDLIFKTLDLLEGKTFTPRREKMADWVLYKLDQGIDHILIDEAQDTNPEQWEIVKALAGEFHAGQGAKEYDRTLFTVGDEKQSIYSFQRASPEEFAFNHENLQQKFKDAEKKWDNIDLNISFRSVQAVLDTVDATFSENKLTGKEVLHSSYRQGQAGRIEIWPLSETEKTPDYDPWEPPVTIRDKQNGAARAAENIASTIAAWLAQGEMLPSRARAIRPGDILILVRTRNAFVDQLSRALKNRNIPVSGNDRIVLTQHIGVQDMLAFCEFALAPHDDLTLACILKSPLIGMEEKTLYDLCYGRSSTLWDSLLQSDHTEIIAYLKHLQNTASAQGPFHTIAGLLQSPCPADERSGLRAMIRRLGSDVKDPLDELLNIALRFEQMETPSLQGFAHAQRKNQAEIRREHEDHSNEVRIMTVHGAKGLEAPIVILPDTTITTFQPAGKADSRFLWPNKSRLPIPLWSPSKNTDCMPFKEGSAHITQRLRDEYKRLLYVAMTRAEDRLYIAGYKNQKDPLPDSWYHMIKQAMEKMPDIEETENDILRYETHQTRDPDRIRTDKNKVSGTEKIPEWIFIKPKIEHMHFTWAAPSQIPDHELTGAPVNSPLQKKDIYRFRRGQLTHRLLEILPSFDLPARRLAAQEFIERYGSDIPSAIRENIVSETLALLENPQFSEIFGRNSQAEVPVAGMVDGQLMNGRIDRLLVTDRTIHIIDYKTNRPPPDDPSKIPEIYRRQMQAYAALLKQIYPNRTVQAALLWTDGPSLMPVDVK